MNGFFDEDSSKQCFLSFYNFRGEMARFSKRVDRERHEELLRRFESGFRPVFEEEFEKEVPRHPWKVLKEVRGERDLSLEERYVLRVLKDEYVEVWQDYKQSFSK